MTGSQSNRPAGIDPGDLGTTNPADLADALDSARRLEVSIDDAPIVTGARFTERVMAALANEPAPAPVGFLSPLRLRGLIGGFGASVRQAWASVGAPGRPTLARAAALAYVLVIVIAGSALAGAATITVAGALGIIGPHQPQPTPTLPAQHISPEPSERPSAESESPGPDASDGPDASEGHGGLEPTDDHGGNSGPGSSGGGGGDDGSGRGGDSATASPTGGDGGDEGGDSSAPKPMQTPRPSETPKSTSGSGGGSDGGGSSG